jgi:hypothetical protein
VAYLAVCCEIVFAISRRVEILIVIIVAALVPTIAFVVAHIDVCFRFYVT